MRPSGGERLELVNEVRNRRHHRLHLFVVDLIQLARVAGAAKFAPLGKRLIAVCDAEHVRDDLLSRPVQTRSPGMRVRGSSQSIEPLPHLGNAIPQFFAVGFDYRDVSGVFHRGPPILHCGG